MKLFRPLASVIAFSLSLALPATAQTAPPSLTDRITALQSDPAGNGFEAGMIMGLRSLEKLFQVQYRHGLTNGLSLGMPRITGASQPKMPLQPETVTDTFTTLLADMDEVRDVLATAADAPQPFTLDLSQIWFDLNANNTFDKGEEATKLLGPLILGRRSFRNANKSDTPPLPIRFDEADLKWLTAYTHMLSGSGNIVLAFDPAPVITEMNAAKHTLSRLPVKPYFHDQATLESEKAALAVEKNTIDAEMKRLSAEQKAVRTQYNDLRKAARDAADKAEKERLTEAYKQFNEDVVRPINSEYSRASRARRALRAEIESIDAKMPPKDLNDRLQAMQGNSMNRARPFVDAIYTLIKSLEQTPDAARIQAARDHYLTMITTNRQFWLAVEQETDDDNEWLPNARQTAPFGLEIDPRAAQTWMQLLGDAESVLQGNLLVPHPLMPVGTGIDLAAYIENPTDLDLVGWIQGTAAMPYMAQGPRITAQYWHAFTRVSGGRAGLFAFYFN